MSGISFVSNEDIEKYLKIVMTQTNYEETVAREKLKDFNYDYMMVIRDYMGIERKKTNPRINSINQEIYKQIRYNLDSNMKEYREKNPINIEQVQNNFTESQEREKDKERKKKD